MNLPLGPLHLELSSAGAMWFLQWIPCLHSHLASITLKIMEISASDDSSLSELRRLLWFLFTCTCFPWHNFTLWIILSHDKWRNFFQFEWTPKSLWISSSVLSFMSFTISIRIVESSVLLFHCVQKNTGCLPDWLGGGKLAYDQSVLFALANSTEQFLNHQSVLTLENELKTHQEL